MSEVATLSGVRRKFPSGGQVSS